MTAAKSARRSAPCGRRTGRSRCAPSPSSTSRAKMSRPTRSISPRWRRIRRASRLLLALLHLHFGVPDDPAPFCEVGLDALAELFRRARDREGHRRRQILFAKRRIAEDFLRLRVELVDDIARRAFRRHQAVPSARLVTRKAFGDGRHIGKFRQARGAAEAEQLQRAGLEMLSNEAN